MLSCCQPRVLVGFAERRLRCYYKQIINGNKFSSQSSSLLIKTKEYGRLLSGSDIAKEILLTLSQEVKKLKVQNSGLIPQLAIVQVGAREDSNVYVKMKLKAAKNIGIIAKHIVLPSSTNEIELLGILSHLNLDPHVHGVIVQMPLDCVNSINSNLITDSVFPNKDVDGLNSRNQGKVAVGDLATGFLPCTPSGCLELVKRSGTKIEGSHTVVIGRSRIVGTPVSELFKWHNATVTTCHSKTKNLDEVVANADILVVAIGQPNLIKGEWIKKGAVVIDCGITSIPDATRKSGSRLVGDVDFEQARKRASWITPVPGGVGPMTVVMLMKNIVLAAVKAARTL
uniref:C-1-tetrahydrofolate synthase, cytoplasmic n=3 Tax=Daphnia magna TaxID=35525 RepID=A0A0N8EMW6_9CRUS